MYDKLKKLLNGNNKVFKLVCGAGNECEQDVERLVALYSLAGCQMFDISANVSILNAAKRGLKYSGAESDRYICISVGIKGDPHISKAKVKKSNCQQCGMCNYVCLNEAIHKGDVTLERCIGCGKCVRVCPAKAIDMYSVNTDLDKVLPELVERGVDCIELHVTSEDGFDIDEKWDSINKNFNGFLSICIDRSYLGNIQVLNRINDLIKNRKPFTTIIQADGIPMSGSENTYKATLQAVAMAEIIQNANLPVYTMLSGGTNSKTVELANMCDIRYSGVSIGSYARKIVKEYISRDDFYSNKVVFNEALQIAKNLVDSVLK